MTEAPKKVRFAGLEGLRTIGIIAVFLSHNGFATGTTIGSGWQLHFGSWNGRPASLLGHLEFGPAIFFMISAFLLYRPFVSAAFGARPAPSNWLWVRRRMVRIFPAYWATLLLLLAMHRISTEGPWHLVQIFTLTQIYTHHAFFALPTLVPTWTLATELTFYIFLLAWVVVMQRVGNGCSPKERLRRELLGAAALAVFALLWRTDVYYGRGLDEVAEHWLPGTLDLFAVGLALAAVDAYSRATSLVPKTITVLAKHADWCAVAALGAAISVPVFTNASEGISYSIGWDAYGRNVFQLLCAAFLLVPVTFVDDGRGLYRRFVTLRPVAYVGLVSYGLYLWHDEWIVRAVEWSGGRVALHAPVWLVGIAAFALSLASGAISYSLVEQPLLEVEAGKRRLRWRPRSAASAGSPW